MHEPTSYTDVIDAFDDGDPFDLNAHVHYTRVNDRGTILREYTNEAGERKRTSIAKSERVVSTLNFGLDVGLYHDLMAFMRLPLIVSDERSLSLPSGKGADVVNARLRDPFDPEGRELFSVPFSSPTRAGFDYIAFGGAWAVLNQQRDPWLPTWVFILEGRRAIGSPLKPCRVDGGDTVCGSVIDQNGDGRNDGTNEEFAGSSAGSSRGVSGVSLETRVSRRYRYAEPYAGLGMLIEWASKSNEYFNPAGRLDGVINALPARQASATLGSAIIPWENPARWQRFALDLSLQATYFSEGHDYSALYDALGTSGHPELARSHYEGVRGIVDPNVTGPLSPCTNPNDTNCAYGSAVPFYGLTDVQAHLRYGFRVGIEMQAAQYVRFAFGSSFNWVTAHAITSADACNPNVLDSDRAQTFRGSTCADLNERGIVNPNHRPTIDLPGRRFWMSGEFIVDLYATATAQF